MCHSVVVAIMLFKTMILYVFFLSFSGSWVQREEALRELVAENIREVSSRSPSLSLFTSL